MERAGPGYAGPPCRSPSSPTSTRTCPPWRRSSADIDERRDRRDLVPRRRRRLRRRPGRLRRARPRALRRLPGRQPRPGGARRARRRLLLRGGGRGGRLDPREHRREHPRVPPRAGADRPARGHRALPRLARATRSGSTCSRSSRPTTACWPSRSRSALIGHSHVSLFFALPEGGSAVGHPRQPGGRRARGSSSTAAAAGWSTRAASASRATATRGRPGWSSTSSRAPALFHRLPYDIDRAAAAIVDAGLPKRLADRLYVGQ